MLVLDYDEKKKRFITVCEYKSATPDEFEHQVEFFKSMYLQYDPCSCHWVWPKNSTIDELLLSLEKEQFEYEITSRSYNVLSEIRSSYKDHFEKYGRIRYNEDVLKDGVQLYNFQKTGINYLLNQNRALCADEPGLGKTVEGITTFSDIFYRGKIDAVILIVRTGTSYDWKKAILDFSNQFVEEDILIVENQNKKDVFKNTNNKILIIPNHLWKDCILHYKTGYKFGQSAKKFRWKEYVDIKEQWQKSNILLMIDEAHEFSNSKSIKYRALDSHKHHFHYIYLLTATPAMNAFYKWKSLIDLLNKEEFKMSDNTFKMYISKQIGDQWDRYSIQEYDIDKVDQITKNVLPKYVIKRRKVDLPEVKTRKIIKPVYISLSNKHLELYRQFLDYEMVKLEEEYDYVSTRLIDNKSPYLIQIIDNPFLLQGKIDSASPFHSTLKNWNFNYDSKIEYLDYALKTYIEENGEKIVLFDNHPMTIMQLERRYAKYNPIAVHGQTGDKEQDKFIKQELFNDRSNDRKLIILNPQIGGASWNLNKGAKRTIFFTLPNDGVLYQQALERCDRINNTENPIVELLLFDKTLDIRRYKKNTNRVNLNNRYLDKHLSKQELKELLEGTI